MIPVYRELAAAGVQLPPGTRAFAVDEYVWPDADHPGTNRSFFRSHWPYQAQAPVRVPRADAAEPEAEIAAHCAAIAAAGGLSLVVLGLGRNGHIAFNEPGSTVESGCRVVALAEETRAQIAAGWQAPPTHGMTIGLHEILAAEQILVLVAGAEKREALAAAFGGSERNVAGTAPPVPAALLAGHPGLTVLCDREAASDFC